MCPSVCGILPRTPFCLWILFLLVDTLAVGFASAYDVAVTLYSPMRGLSVYVLEHFRN